MRRDADSKPKESDIKGRNREIKDPNQQKINLLKYEPRKISLSGWNY